MKRVALLVALAACESKPVAAPVVDATSAPASSASATATASATASASASAPAPAPATPGTPPGRRAAKAGEMCGGIAGIPCDKGLVCKMVGPMHPDKSGTCVASD